METQYLIGWYLAVLVFSLLTWRATVRITHTASRILLRTLVPATGLAVLPLPGQWVPAIMYVFLGRDWLESLGIALIAVGVLWGGLFATYWLVLVYQDALFGNRERNHP